MTTKSAAAAFQTSRQQSQRLSTTLMLQQQQQHPCRQQRRRRRLCHPHSAPLPCWWLVIIIAVLRMGRGQAQTNAGADFWIAQPPNTALLLDNCSHFSLTIVNTDAHAPATVWVDYPLALNASSSSSTQLPTNASSVWHVLPQQATLIQLPCTPVAGTTVVPTRRPVYHVTSDRSIVVSAFPASNTTVSSDATTILPTSVLGTSYRLWTYQEATFASFFGMVATYPPLGGRGEDPNSVSPHQNDTNTTTTTIVQVQASNGTVVFNVSLSPGEYYQYVSSSSSSSSSVPNKTSLSGWKLVANHPIAVWSGSPRTNVGGAGTADLLWEQVLPDSVLSKTYLTCPTQTRPLGCHPAATTFGSSSSSASSSLLWNGSHTSANWPPCAADVIRYLAYEDNTTLIFAAAGDNNPQANNQSSTILLQAGEYHDDISATPQLVTASHPIAVYAYLVGEDVQGTWSALETAPRIGGPSFYTVPSSEQFLYEYDIVTPPQLFEYNFAHLIYPKDAMLFGDGEPLQLPSGPCQEIVGTNYCCTHFRISDGYHRIRSNQRFGLTVSGFDVSASYSLVGGMNLEPINEGCYTGGPYQFKVFSLPATVTLTGQTSCRDSAMIEPNTTWWSQNPQLQLDQVTTTFSTSPQARFKATSFGDFDVCLRVDCEGQLVNCCSSVRITKSSCDAGGPYVFHSPSLPGFVNLRGQVNCGNGLHPTTIKWSSGTKGVYFWDPYSVNSMIYLSSYGSAEICLLVTCGTNGTEASTSCTTVEMQPSPLGPMLLSDAPSDVPSSAPSDMPSYSISIASSSSDAPSHAPSDMPSNSISIASSSSDAPSHAPSDMPSLLPTLFPTTIPSAVHSKAPASALFREFSPSAIPSAVPTRATAPALFREFHDVPTAVPTRQHALFRDFSAVPTIMPSQELTHAPLSDSTALKPTGSLFQPRPRHRRPRPLPITANPQPQNNGHASSTLNVSNATGSETLNNSLNGTDEQGNATGSANVTLNSSNSIAPTESPFGMSPTGNLFGSGRIGNLFGNGKPNEQKKKSVPRPIDHNKTEASNTTNWTTMGSIQYNDTVSQNTTTSTNSSSTDIFGGIFQRGNGSKNGNNNSAANTTSPGKDIGKSNQTSDSSKHNSTFDHIFGGKGGKERNSTQEGNRNQNTKTNNSGTPEQASHKGSDNNNKHGIGGPSNSQKPNQQMSKSDSSQSANDRNSSNKNSVNSQKGRHSSHHKRKRVRRPNSNSGAQSGKESATSQLKPISSGFSNSNNKGGSQGGNSGGGDSSNSKSNNAGKNQPRVRGSGHGDGANIFFRFSPVAFPGSDSNGLFNGLWNEWIKKTPSPLGLPSLPKKASKTGTGSQNQKPP